MNEKKLSRPLISLIVSIALIIVGIAGSFILQTNSGKTTIRNVTIESESKSRYHVRSAYEIFKVRFP